LTKLRTLDILRSKRLECGRMIPFLLTYLLAGSYPTLDITASGLDYWVAWGIADGDRVVRSSTAAEVKLPGYYGSTSLTIGETVPGVPENLILMCSAEYYDSARIYSLDPATLAEFGSASVPYGQICPPAEPHFGCSVFQLSAQSVIDEDTGCVIFASVRTNYTLSSADDRVSHYTWQCAAILDTDDSGQMVFREPAALEVLFGCNGIPPVQTDPSYWVSGWGGYGGTYPPYGFMVQATGYDGLGGSRTLDSSTLNYVYGASPTAATAYCAGNSSAGTVIVWENYEGVDQYSLICSTSSPVPDTTIAMPPWPNGQPPLFAAMSDVREDPGALLAWYDGASVWCRYFDGQWNDWCYLLSPDEPIDVDTGFLGVCSAQDGYYVAWLEYGSADPTVVYVPRPGVEGTEDALSFIAGELLLQPSMNPFVSSITLICSGSSIPVELSVFDMTGRLVRNLTDRQGSSFLWDGRDVSGTVVPTGTYLIQGAVNGQATSIRVVKL
jgi:hypothetical protein